MITAVVGGGKRHSEVGYTFIVSLHWTSFYRLLYHQQFDVIGRSGMIHLRIVDSLDPLSQGIEKQFNCHIFISSLGT